MKVGAVTDEGVDSINNETRQTPSSMPGGRLDTKVLTIDSSTGGIVHRQTALFLLNLIH